MRCVAVLLGATVLSFLVPANAESTCPWINAATIAGASGVSISVDVQKSGSGGTCSFAYHHGKALRRVRINVEDTGHSMSMASYRARCATRVTRLDGIGNEAVICRVKPRFPYAEQVIGRVRDRRFVVFISSTSPPETSMSADTIRNTATKIAEQVAGNLY
jgi:hypothetical protein